MTNNRLTDHIKDTVRPFNAEKLYFMFFTAAYVKKILFRLTY